MEKSNTLLFEFHLDVSYNPARLNMADSSSEYHTFFDLPQSFDLVPDSELQALAESVGKEFRGRGLKLATAESCTGGFLGHLITNVPGCSEYYLGGIVAYAYEAKTALLGVPQDLLLKYGAVSKETALEMARGACQRFNSDVTISTTGILGPGGATPTKPVGLVYVASVSASTEVCSQFVWSGDRTANKRFTAKAALEILIKFIQTMHGH